MTIAIDLQYLNSLLLLPTEKRFKLHSFPELKIFYARLNNNCSFHYMRLTSYTPTHFKADSMYTNRLPSYAFRVTDRVLVLHGMSQLRDTGAQVMHLKPEAYY